MGALKGNQNALGHDGSRAGRKTAIIEGKNAEMLRQIMFGKVDVKKLERKIKAKRYGGIHRLALQILEGRMPEHVFNRIFPEVKEKQSEPRETFKQLQEILEQTTMPVSEHTMMLYEQNKAHKLLNTSDQNLLS